MKRRCLAVVGAAVICFSALSAAAEAAKIYTDPVFLYSIYYPESWRLKRIGKYAVLVSPLESKEDRFAENISVVAEDLSKLPQNVTLIDYYRQSVGNAKLQDFKVLEEARTVWMGRDAITNLYTATEKGERFRCKTYTFMVGPIAYVLTYTAEYSGYETHLPVAERIMRSIRVSP